MNKEVILEIARKAGIKESQEKIILFAELLKEKIFEEFIKYFRKVE